MWAKKTLGILLSLILSLFALPYATPHLFAFGGGRQDAGQPREVEVTGRVRLVGTSRFPSLVISGEERDWFIDGGEREKLMGLQQQVVTVRAQKHTYEMRLANGLVSHSHYVLRNIVIVRVEGER
ncbi:MAG: hypothetical protein FWB79_04055 [Treponema sp.]|nr:hypothetical protein [Treponema sp.]